MLRELAQLTTLDEQSVQSFRVRAYENAMRAVESYSGDLAALNASQLSRLSGIGKSTAKKIREYFDNGEVAKLALLRERFPRSVVELSRVPGLGPKTLARVRAELGVESVADLRKAIAEQRLRDLPGLGAKSEEKLVRALDRLGLTGKDRRMPIAEAMPIARRLVRALSALPAARRVEHCGSLRRFRETVGDIDVLVGAHDGAPIMAALVELPGVGEVLARGETKTSLIMASSGLQVDVRVVAPEGFGAALMYFTGSKAHNIRLRQRALSKGWLLNEYGLFRDGDAKVLVAAETEEAIYESLGLPWIAPPMREDTGEIEAAERGSLTETLTLDGMRGDLHVHTALSGDGRSPIEEMLSRAASRDYRYLAITDHAEDLAINGVSRQALLEQRLLLAELQPRFPDMALLHGVELNIGPDGGLDYDQDFRMSFDWCVAAVHSHFDLDMTAQTRRVICAMENPAVNVIGHLTGRKIGHRPGIELDISAILEAAGRTKTAVEINCALPRLDAATEVLRRARDLGVTLVMSTDAHHVGELDRMQWGVQHAARGWVEAGVVANTWAPERFLAWAEDARRP